MNFKERVDFNKETQNWNKKKQLITVFICKLYDSEVIVSFSVVVVAKRLRESMHRFYRYCEETH